MEVNENREQIEERIVEEEIKPEFSENIVEEMNFIVKLLLEKSSWNGNISISNRKEQKEKFLEAEKNGENFRPEFTFSRSEGLGTLESNIREFGKATERIEKKDLENVGLEKLGIGNVRKFYTEVLEELRLYVELARKVDDRENWREISEKIWSAPSREGYFRSLEAMKELDPSEKTGSVSPQELKNIFEEELEELGIDYNVEVRKSTGCHNIPEKNKLIVASGLKGNRTFSGKEAEMLAKHETFHVARGVNGSYLSSKIQLPLGIHTPFYDRTEEGGAVYRERQTGFNYPAKDFDYSLRYFVAYRIYQGDTLQEIVDEAVELGAEPERCFELYARNREILRHHIYLDGVQDWTMESREKLLIGKVNTEWADILRDELEEKISLNELPVRPGDIFQ